MMPSLVERRMRRRAGGRRSVWRTVLRGIVERETDAGEPGDGIGLDFGFGEVIARQFWRSATTRTSVTSRLSCFLVRRAISGMSAKPFSPPALTGTHQATTLPNHRALRCSTVLSGLFNDCLVLVIAGQNGIELARACQQPLDPPAVGVVGSSKATSMRPSSFWPSSSTTRSPRVSLLPS